MTETHEASHTPQITADPGRERIALAGFGLLAVATGSLLFWAHSQPHVGPAPETDATSTVHLAPGQAVKHFPSTKVDALKALASTSLKDARSGNATGAHAAAQSLRDLWDADQASLQPLDNTGWTFIDAQMDQVLKTFGIDHPNPPMSPARQETELNTLLTDMR
ncbi:hypothetical protein ACN6LA_003787 [Streptomyces sp. SAS_269]|uniref:hypothetical protein n=1 Tax=Streptomyces sp. SAS_269 TaxID=3412749 RepID=UPI00403CCF5A